ncbi:serine hydrolase domain-containing protein [Amycolatopsis nigrescens]|uniref:serine hydrolase domain-containing protein n=1 Tax=Amycolatopsis nigrescens TaxID=381445 RepID=UPI000360875F|nr:serine hydrolase domain-containing protein [Amycolatopsis nigrescens]
MLVSVRRRVFAVAAAAVMMAGVAVASNDSAFAGRVDDGPYPGAEWERGDPAAAGFDPAKLAQIAEELKADKSNCLAVVRHGRLVADWYWNDTGPESTQEVFSATKSVSSTLVGIAQAEQKLSIDDAASKYLPSWVGTPSADVTVKDLLSNDSGRHWKDLVTDTGQVFAAPDRTAFAVSQPQDVPPGEVWAYNNTAIQTLDDVLQTATGDAPADYAEKKLFEPLGMQHTDLTRDRAVNTNMFFGMQSTCQDMARFGYLFLRNGHWNDTQVVSEQWVGDATGKPSQDLTTAYGYLWWLNRLGPVASVGSPMTREDSANAPHTQLIPSAPQDMYWAQGLGGQTVQVDPGSDTVVVRLGPPSLTSPPSTSKTARIVTEALVHP